MIISAFTSNDCRQQLQQRQIATVMVARGRIDTAAEIDLAYSQVGAAAM